MRIAAVSFFGLCLTALTALPLQGKTAESKDDGVTLIAGGDVTWTQRVRKPEYYFGTEKRNKRLSNDGWRGIPYLATPENRAMLEQKFNRKYETSKSHFRRAIQYQLSFPNEAARLAYPFRKVASVLKSADIAFINLESPLSDTGRQSGAFRVPTAFARYIAKAGIDIVSTANNHAFDAEGQGIAETLLALQIAGVRAVGTGKNLEDAASAKIVEAKGQKFAFLAFTYGVNPTITPLGFAHTDKSGAAPMDPQLIAAQIAKVKNEVDFVILSLHWGLENKTTVHPAAVEFAHHMIEIGADVVLGHHPHVPRGIEQYKDGLIIYSMGNLIFGHGHQKWEDNFLIRLTFGSSRIVSAEVLPVAGAGKDVTQPYLLTGQRAKLGLQKISSRSAVLGSSMTVTGDIGFLDLSN